METLRRLFPGNDINSLADVRDLVLGKLDPYDFDIELVMEIIDSLLDGYGVESIIGRWHNRYYHDTQALYVNFGDTYDMTVLYDCEEDKFILTSWGDWVEKNSAKREIQ
jgi:hypothetical protein